MQNWLSHMQKYSAFGGCTPKLPTKALPWILPGSVPDLNIPHQQFLGSPLPATEVYIYSGR